MIYLFETVALLFFQIIIVLIDRPTVDLLMLFMQSLYTLLYPRLFVKFKQETTYNILVAISLLVFSFNS